MRIVLLCFLVFGAMASSYADTQFLVVSDIHYGSKNTSKMGSDTGISLFKLTMGKLEQLSKEVDFILCLGDLPTHESGHSLKKGGYEYVVFHGLYAADVARKPMFYVAGNNDSLGGNYLPFSHEGISPLNVASDWNGACVHCEGLLIDDQFMRSQAYYSTYVVPGNKDLILIALNTTQWMKPRFFRPAYPNQDKDALAQLYWLEQQMQNHRGQQLLIAMHQPPGRDFKGMVYWKKEYQQRFIKILQENQQHFAAITLLSAHTHRDEIRKITLADGRAIYDFSTPAISRIYYNNPGMKIFDLNDKLQLENFTTYYTTQENQWQEEHYQALGGPESIFSNCQQPTLVQCLDTLNKRQLCNYMDQGNFYGVKSSKVDSACELVYQVN